MLMMMMMMISRTGRAGAVGHAITLFTETDKAQSGAYVPPALLHRRHSARLRYNTLTCLSRHYSLINVLKAAKQDVPEDLLKFGTTVKKKQHDAYGAFFKDVDTSKTAIKIKFDD